MGQSDLAEKLGLKRGQDTMRGLPEKYIVVGRDIAVDDLKALYVGNITAHAVIDGIAQRYRTAKDPPPEFIETLSIGVIEPVIYTNIGADKNGKYWPLICEGRQRTMGLRVKNAERIAAGLPSYEMQGLSVKLVGANAGSVARQIKIMSGSRVEISPMARCADAHDLFREGLSKADIAKMMTLTSEQAVTDIMALADCSPAVQAAVDLGVKSGGITQTIAVKLSKLPPAEQDKKLANAAGKKGAAALAEVEGTDAAPRMQKKAHVERVTTELRKIDPKSFKGQESEISDAKAILEYLMGNQAALSRCPGFFRLAVENALVPVVREKKPSVAPANDSAVEKVDVDSIEIEDDATDDIEIEEEAEAA